jgi:pyruvate dehydrogenase E1 component
MNEEARLAIRDRLGIRSPTRRRPARSSTARRRTARAPATCSSGAGARREPPRAHTDAEPLPTPPPFDNVLEGSGERENSTTMALVRILNTLVATTRSAARRADRPRRVTDVRDGGMFRQLGIFSQVGQLYEPEDAGDFMFYREDQHGQILQEGINEAGAFSSWLAAATSYANHGTAMIPFYIFYSMFGFQRVGDLAWAAGDSRARGFLIGGTAGRTTLNGEGSSTRTGTRTCSRR